MNSSNQALLCAGVACGYHGKAVLRGVDLSLAPGDRVALLGPNGSGKSTLLKTVSREIPRLTGEIKIKGKSIDACSYRDLAREIAVVPQEEFSYFPFSVEEVVMMGRLPVSGAIFDSETDRAVVDAALDQADCSALRNRSILELSGGEKQRVWIARALAQGAKILLLDEPSSHLDFSHQVALVGLLRELADKGLSILAAVHDLNIAAALGGRGVLLASGGIALNAPMEQLLADPALEDVYKVKFKRVESSAGLRVLPPY